MGSCGANRSELEDQRAIKGKLDQKGVKTKFGLSFFWKSKNVKERRREKEREEEEEEEGERYGTICVWICDFVYGTRILNGTICVWICDLEYGN